MTPPHRRRSVDSSDSSVHDQPQSNMQDIEKRDKVTSSASSGEAQVAFPIPADHGPPSYTYPGPAAQVPPSGHRVQLGVFPGIDITHEAPFTDADGKSPVFIGSAILEDGSVHPCKIAPCLPGAPCRVPFGGDELEHHGRYDLLPFVPELMEFVVTSRGHVPPGRRPVKGGSESGHELYHAVAVIDGVKVPGKAGFHLGGCNIPFGGREHIVTEKYEILCWRY
ncbi:hypothetical protein EDB83DRAFT_497921 [Lactarius deliciosus]|nr:hypothetical protein EDB83DRAFT_497921 [Lactarius deliciosus]